VLVVSASLAEIAERPERSGKTFHFGLESRTRIGNYKVYLCSSRDVCRISGFIFQDFG